MNKKAIFIIICIIAVISVIFFLTYFPSKSKCSLSLYEGSNENVTFGIYNMDKTKTFQWKIFVLNTSDLNQMRDEQEDLRLEKLNTYLSKYGTVFKTGYVDVQKNKEVNVTVELNLNPKELTLIVIQLGFCNNLTTYYWLRVKPS